MFFNLRVVSKSPAEMSTPIGAVLNCALVLICPVLVNLVLGVFTHIQLKADFKVDSEIGIGSSI